MTGAGAIEEFQKDLALDPNNVDAHYNLGLAFEHIGDFQSSLREYREGKRLAPGKYDVRQNLGAGLMNHGFAADAVVEFRELEKLYPNAAMCHYCWEWRSTRPGT